MFQRACSEFAQKVVNSFSLGGISEALQDLMKKAVQEANMRRVDAGGQT